MVEIELKKNTFKKHNIQFSLYYALFYQKKIK